MTKREPFARVVRFGRRGRLAVGSIYISEPTLESESYCGRINTAHEARVKEAVREAVVEFKARAANALCPHCSRGRSPTESKSGRMVHGNSACQGYVIRSLPTFSPARQKPPRVGSS